MAFASFKHDISESQVLLKIWISLVYLKVLEIHKFLAVFDTDRPWIIECSLDLVRAC